MSESYTIVQEKEQGLLLNGVSWEVVNMILKEAA